MEEKINTQLANDLEQSAAMLDSREFDAVQLDNCASMMRYAATVIRQALANEALDKMADNAKELGLSYEQPAQQDPVAVETDKVICPNCAHQFRAIPVDVQQLMLDACFEPPFTTPPAKEPVAWMVTTEMHDGSRSTYPVIGRYKDVKDLCDFGEPAPLVYGYTTPPAPAPVPLTDERILSCPYDNSDMRSAFSEGWLKAEAAHGITKGKP